MTTKHLPKNVFLHFLMVGALYFSAFSFIALFFQYIDIWLPDVLNYYHHYDHDGINYSIAALFVLFPVYLIVSWLIGRETKKQPELREFGLRRWLIYLTLFITAIAIISGLVTLVYNFLNGELTTPFLLKVLTVFVVTGAVFWYFLWDIKGKLSRSLNKKLALVASVVVIIAIVIGFVLAGSPFHQREVRLDEQRINHLQDLQYKITNYWANKLELPGKLANLNDALQNFEIPTDPETGKNYDYEILDKLSFKLCAEFSTEQKKGKFEKEKPLSYWAHPEGYYCFDRKIDPDFAKRNEEKPIPVREYIID